MKNIELQQLIVSSSFLPYEIMMMIYDYGKNPNEQYDNVIEQMKNRKQKHKVHKVVVDGYENKGYDRILFMNIKTGNIFSSRRLKNRYSSIRYGNVLQEGVYWSPRLKMKINI